MQHWQCSTTSLSFSRSTAPPIPRAMRVQSSSSGSQLRCRLTSLMHLSGSLVRSSQVGPTTAMSTLCIMARQSTSNWLLISHGLWQANPYESITLFIRRCIGLCALFESHPNSHCSRYLLAGVRVHTQQRPVCLPSTRPRSRDGWVSSALSSFWSGPFYNRFTTSSGQDSATCFANATIDCHCLELAWCPASFYSRAIITRTEWVPKLCIKPCCSSASLLLRLWGAVNSTPDHVAARLIEALRERRMGYNTSSVRPLSLLRSSLPLSSSSGICVPLLAALCQSACSH